ncbi:MAG: PEP-CTERM sorting domain-containing protein [Gammaproteobacteria bacterium]|jgi:hypothetical protein|nr:PEP-CTERM sorting domain-containing protein [Gammaproteobacteria bacterium]
MIKRVAAGIGLAMAMTAPAFAGNSIIFDPDGVGGFNGDTTVGSFDWLPGTATAIGAVPPTGGQFTTYAHATLVGLTDAGGNPLIPLGLNSGNPATNFEITFVAGFEESVSSFSQGGFVLQNDGGAAGGGDDVYTFTQTLVLGDPTAPTTNFFEIYWDDRNDGSTLNADALSGTGFNDGILIASGEVASVAGSFTTEFTFVDANDDGDYNPGDGDIIIGSGNPVGGYQLLDGSADGDQWGGQQSVTGLGTTSLSADLTFQNTDFFKTDITSLLFDLEFNTSNVLPFQETNPSQQYWDGGSFQAPNLGEVNGLTGPDIIFQSDANNSFVTEVPEPRTVLLFALGLLLLAASARRKQAPELVA